MPPKTDKAAKDKAEGKKAAAKLSSKLNVPIPRGPAMAQRVLPPTVCCPPQGCRVNYCLPGPGCWHN